MQGRPVPPWRLRRLSVYTSSFVSELNVSWAVACDRAQEPPIAPCDVLGKRGKAARAASSPPHPKTSGAARAQGFSTSRRRRCVPTTSNQALRRPAMRTPPAERSRRGKKVLRQGSKSTQQCSWSALECILPVVSGVPGGGRQHGNSRVAFCHVFRLLPVTCGSPRHGEEGRALLGRGARR